MMNIPTTRARRFLVPAVTAVVVFVVIPTAVLAQVRATSTVIVGPSKDNTLYESGSGALSNGAGHHMFVGRTGSGATRRAIFAFDVSGVPTGATINTVSLKLNMSRTTSGAQTVTLHKLLADWGEGSSFAGGNEGGGGSSASGDATWVHRFFNSTSWTSAGGDFNPTSSASQTVSGNGAYSWSSAQMVADVQAWVNASSTNFGWLLKGNESSIKTTKRFDTRENSTASNRPTLTITFTMPAPTPTPTPAPPVPGTGTWGLIVIAGLLAAAGLWKTWGQPDSHTPSR